MTKPYVIGLTGGIGSGKSMVSQAFAKHGIKIIDTDLISRNLTSSGGKAIDQIRQLFGNNFILPDGSLDRNLIRTSIFRDSEALNRLESILHPLIRTQVSYEIAHSKGPYIILVVPLLLEKSGYTDIVDRVLVVDCDESLQVQRVINRNALDESLIKNIMRNQLSRSIRLSKADDVIDNSSNLDTLENEVKILHKRYLSLSQR